METGVSNKTLSLFDLAALQQNATEHYHLSIQLGLNGFSFCIRNNNIILAIESNQHMLSQLENTLKNHKWMNKKYASTLININTNKHTLIPDSIFDVKEQQNYIRFNHHRSENQEAFSDKLQQIEAHQVYGISVPEQELINTFFPKATIRHYGSTLIDNILQHKTNSAQLYIHVQDKSMDILFCNKKGLHFFNSFKYQSSEDFIYYTLFVCEQLELNPDEIDCCLLGEVDKSSVKYDLAYKYIRNIRFIKRNENVQLSPVINQIPEHFYYPLLHQHLCV